MPNLTVGSFHSTCRQLAKEAGIELPAGSEAEMNDAVLPSALLDAVDARPDLKFDTVVVDEGQDFDDRWLDTLRLSLSDFDGGGFFVFFDDNQIIFKRGNQFINSLPTAKHRLNRNLRNTRRIFEVTMAWYQGRLIHPAGPEGSPVEWVLCKDAADARRKAETDVANKIRRREIQPGHIAVLSAASQDEISSRSRSLGAMRICGAEDANADCVVYETVRRFKGLSRPCVFLIDTHLLSEQELAYVALSRANVLLHVYGTREHNERLAHGLAKIS